jgi:intracellular septation protein A
MQATLTLDQAVEAGTAHGNVVVLDRPDAQPARHAVHLPPFLQLLKHGGMHLAEATIIPLGLFYTLLWLEGLRPALLAALAWSYLMISIRLVRKQRLPGLLLLATATLTVRTAISFAANSAFFYFLQPTLGNFAVAALFLTSVRLGRPLARKLADDLVPLPGHLLDRAAISRIFARITVLWAVVNLANGSTALWALLQSSLGGVLLARTVGSFTIMTIGVYVSYLWFRRGLHREGYTLRWGAATA